MAKSDRKKVALIGTGMVGMSYAYAMLNQNGCDEMVLIDINKERTIGEAMDLNHGLAFAPSAMKIYAGDYSDCTDADIVVICAGVAQKPGESRLDLLNRNVAVFRTIIEPIVAVGFHGIFLVATNPVDIMTYVTRKLSGFPAARVIGSGTTLDTARLRFLVGEYFDVNPRNIHAYVIGEHGDSEFVPWSQALIATKPVFDVINQNREYSMSELITIQEEVRTSAQVIIEAKKATYYGIGMALTRITKAIFQDENSVLTVSSMLCGEYGEQDVTIGVPTVVNRNGVKDILELTLNDEEVEKFKNSCNTLREFYDGLEL